jgi:DNA-binding transcriptional LysR family regulator
MRARGWRDYSMIELRHLRYFIAGAECGSFRRAAKRFGVQESAVSRRIRDLEDEFGVAVFIRSHAGISPIRHGNRRAARTGSPQQSAASTKSARGA